jgi:hypothetical protein
MRLLYFVLLPCTAAISAAANWSTGCSDLQLHYLERALIEAVHLGRIGAATATGPNAAKG